MPKKTPIVKVYRYYFFGLFKKEIQNPYSIDKNGQIIFSKPISKRDRLLYLILTNNMLFTILYLPLYFITVCIIILNLPTSN